MKKNTIQAVIIDDEKLAREALFDLIKQYCPSVEVIGQADSRESGQELINTVKPDLIFLDIEMPFGSGFDLLSDISDINAEVIFTTAHDQYALKAIKISALDYLLKPVKKNELIEAVEKFRKKDWETTHEMLTLLTDQLKHGPTTLKRIGIASLKGITVVDVADIMYCEADGNYTNFKLSGAAKLLTASKTLKEYENILSSASFVRTHQKYLINVSHVKEYLRGRGGSIIMDDGKVIDVSQNKRSEVLKAIGGLY